MKIKKIVRGILAAIVVSFLAINLCWLPYYLKCRTLYDALVEYYGMDSVSTEEVLVVGSMPKYLHYDARFAILQKKGYSAEKDAVQCRIYPDLYIFPRSFRSTVMATSCSVSYLTVIDEDGIEHWDQHFGYAELDRKGTPVDELSEKALHPIMNAYGDIFDLAEDIWGMPDR